MKKILIVFGTRPEAIKMAPLILKLREQSHILDVKICITAQHRQMLDQVLSLFGIHPDYDLNIMMPGQDLFDISSRILLSMRNVLREYKPDIVLVHGDTTTSTFAALAAFYERIDVGHVEAGLRTGNIYSPWPEEMNRQLTSRIAKWHFAPTLKAKQNLLAENIAEPSIMITGNTVIDALFLALDQINNNKNLEKQILENIKESGITDIEEIIKNNSKIILVTGHRRENFGEGFRNICIALQKFASEFPDIFIIYPVHLNPNVQTPVYEMLSSNKNIKLIKPLEYLTFIYLMQKSYVILTDSGGVQEEAPSLGKPVLVMRDTTERPEALEAGTVRLIGTNSSLIVQNLKALILSENEYNNMSKSLNPYGDGDASERIVKHLIAN